MNTNSVDVSRFRHLFFLGSTYSLLSLLIWSQFLFAQSITDRDCFACHKDSTLKQALSNGQIQSLYVDPKDWQRDVHQKNGFSCVDCHTDAIPFSHPVGGFRGNDCALCHAEDCEEFSRTIHAIQHGTEEIPDCFDCHTKHSIRPKDDPEASISEGKIAAVCSSCHPSEAASKDWFNKLVFFRVSGHKKEDISGQYDMSLCIKCHFKDGAHGQPGVLAERCATCHRKGAGIDKLFSRSVHASTILGNGSLVAGLKLLYGFILIGIVGVLATFLIRMAKRLGKGEEDPAS